jgi:hypothetical protein
MQLSATTRPTAPFATTYDTTQTLIDLLRCLQVDTEAKARAAIQAAKQLRDHFVFIEVIVDKRDGAPGAVALRQGFVSRHFRWEI